MIENINDALKQSVLDYLKLRLKKYGSDTVSGNGKSYSSEKMIAEIESDTAFGLEMVHDMVTLTIDRMSRNSIATWRLASDKPKLIVKGFDEVRADYFVRSDVVLGLCDVDVYKTVYVEFNKSGFYWLDLDYYKREIKHGNSESNIETVSLEFIVYKDPEPSLWTYDPLPEHILNIKS